MKILLRRWGNEYYVWKDATYTSNGFVYDGEVIYTTNILAIKDDNRKDSVMCAHCGKIIKNDPESIEAHFAEQEAGRDCFKCGSLRKYNVKTTKADYIKNADGQFTVTETYSADLKCGQQWYGGPSIDDERVKKICIYYRCRNVGVKPIKDIFTQYPDPFDKNVTVDMLLAKKFAHDGYTCGHFEYDLKCRNTVKACVNEVGIVDHFVIKHRGYRWNAFYSAKYDKLFFSINGRDYEDCIPNALSETKYNQAKAKISALYKEEENK